MADSGEWNRDSEKDDNINNKSFTMTEEQQFLTYAKITDYAGNVTYLYPKEIAVLDRTWAEPKITITAAEPLYGIYNKDVPFSINVERSGKRRDILRTERSLLRGAQRRCGDTVRKL